MLIINDLRLIRTILFFIASLNITYVARHTMATTVCLVNGVPIESLSKVLGHTNIKTTQLYAKITDEKLSNDLAILKAKID